MTLHLPLFALLGALIAQTQAPTSPATGPDPGAASSLVRQALDAEAAGQLEIRNTLLRQALDTQPQHPAARGLLGEMADGSTWRNAADPRDEPAHAARRTAYLARREALDIRDQAAHDQIDKLERFRRNAEAGALRIRALQDLADGHADLADWCQKSGLEPEARAHRMAALQIDPTRDRLWKQLGYTRYEGRWLDPDQLDQAKADAAAQREADKLWAPRLKQARLALASKDPARQQAARHDLADIRDPRAVPQIVDKFAHGSQAEQLQAIQILGQIDGPASTRALASLALKSDFEPVRQQAARALAHREPADYADALVDLLEEPWRYSVTATITGPGTRGSILVDSARVSLLKLYDAPASFQLTPGDQAVARLGPTGRPIVMTSQDANTIDRLLIRSDDRLRALTDAESRTAQLMSNAQARSLDVQSAMASDIQAIETQNAQATLINGRVIDILHASLDAPPDLGDDTDAWRKWWYDQNGYTYEPPPKVELIQQFSVSPPPLLPAPRTGECFAAGTPVHTPDGPVSIESLQVGDRVLAQDTATGALHDRPILATHFIPSDDSVRLVLDDPASPPLVATPHHRFWIPGEGWRMARDLKTGDSVRTLGRTARVVSTQPGDTIPVYNLTVADDATFFAGHAAALVRDNTRPDPRAPRFDASQP
jgi:hypothetical protein